MEIVGIDHVQLAMPAGREAEARAFYAGLLGLTEVAKPPALAGRGGCWFEGGAARLHLGVEADFRPSRKAHPALLIRDLPRLKSVLSEAGVEVVEDGLLPGFDRIYVCDPFGNRLELLEPVKTPDSASAPISILLLPGLGDSGPEHWQSYWEREDSACERIVQDEWEASRREDWAARLDEVVAARSGPLVLAAHSSACLLVAHWANIAGNAGIAGEVALRKIRGALLVGPSDPEGPIFPPGPTGFAPVPLDPLPFPSIVVASDDDPYVTAAQARRYAEAWGSRFVLLHGAGHLNSASGLGSWPQGRALLKELTASPPEI